MIEAYSAGGSLQKFGLEIHRKKLRIIKNEGHFWLTYLFFKKIVEFHMFISIFYMNKVFFTYFFLFLTGVIYGVQYNSATVSK
jgi:hypothetical protein